MSARGVAISAELEAIVLACLSKDPNRRPQSAAELLRRIEACTVEPWTGEAARTWWSQHQVELDATPVEPTGETKAIEVDAAQR